MRVLALPLMVLLNGIGGIVAAQERGCAARGGMLTASGCQGGGGGFGLPGRIGNAPPTDRYGQAIYNDRGEYVGGHGTGLLVDRPAAEPSSPIIPPSALNCTVNAAGNAQVCN